MKRFLLFAAISLVVLHGKGQQYSFVNYTTHNGLVQSSITDIKQDKEGNIWIGTTGGLSMFDGKKFTNFDDRQVLQSLQINSIYCDSSGIIYVGTGNGLISYDHSFKTIFKPEKKVQNNTGSIISYPGKNILFVCNNKIYEIQKDRKVKALVINNVVEKITELITYDAKGQLWLATMDGRIFRVSANSAIEYKRPLMWTMDLKNMLRFIRLIGNAGPEPFFVSTVGTLAVKGDSLSFISSIFPAFYSPVTGGASFIMKDNDSTIWFGANKGLVKLINGDSAVRFTKQNGFGDHSVSTIMRDREQNLWIGSTYNGVYKLSNESLFTIHTADSIDLKFIKAIAPLNDSQSIAGTWGNGMHLITGQNVKPLRYDLSKDLNEWAVAFKYTNALFRVGKATYSCTLGAGIWKIEDGSLTAKEIHIFDSPRQILFVAPYHNNYILQALDGGAFYLDKNFKIISGAKQEMNIFEVIGDYIFNADITGAINLVDTAYKNIKVNIFPEIGTEVSQIIPWKDVFVVATMGDGLFIYDHNFKLKKQINKKSGLNSNVITAIMADGNKLYAGTNFGLILVDLENMQVKRIFNEDEGMFNWECRRRGIVKLNKEEILIATTNGPYFYFPSRDNTAELAKGYLTVSLFTSGPDNKKRKVFKSDNGNGPLPDKIPYSENHITVEMKGVSQRAPDNVIYHYRLNGFEKEWHVTNETIPLEYNNIPPGNFTFESFIVVNNFTSPLSAISFSIKKPLQSELWFQAIVLAIVAIFIFWFLNFLNRFYQKYIQTKITDDLGKNIERKKTLINEALKRSSQQLNSFENLSKRENEPGSVNDLAHVYIAAENKRMQILLQSDSVSLNAFHNYFDAIFCRTLLNEKRIFQEIADGTKEIATDKAFALMEIFSLFMLWKLSQNQDFLFSLNSEVRTNHKLVLRCYNMNNFKSLHPSPIQKIFGENLQSFKKQGWSIDLIENQETSSMLIVEMDL